MRDYRAPLKQGLIYHIYNHAVGNENLFLEEENYTFFIDRFEKYITPLANFYAFCLMPNHFHFILYVKENEEQIEHVIPTAFKSFFTSYTNSYNKFFNRRGSLFEQKFKRKIIEDNNQLISSIVYVHNNPVSHGFADKPEEWRYSSYNHIINNKKMPWLLLEEVIGLFDNLENFVYCHRLKIKKDIEFP